MIFLQGKRNRTPVAFGGYTPDIYIRLFLISGWRKIGDGILLKGYLKSLLLGSVALWELCGQVLGILGIAFMYIYSESIRFGKDPTTYKPNCNSDEL